MLMLRNHVLCKFGML
uniref:Uncharacterized protein n=1 Tax=Arundo donax TaxID=35708 RepID=A0A0A9BC83_ARUDO